MRKFLTSLSVAITVTLFAAASTFAQAPGTPAIPQQAPATSNDKPNKPKTDDKWISIGTGSVTGVYYPAGGAICRMINKDAKTLNLRCGVESTPGSVYNVDGLRTSEFDFAIIQSDWQEHAYNGTGLFQNKGRFDKMRHVMSLHNEAMTMIVQKHTNINKLDDIKGKIVNMGSEGSGVRATMEDLMKAKGWTKADFKSVAELKTSDQAKALCNGTIDVMILATGHPNGLVQEVASLCETKMIDLDDDGVRNFLSGNPELSVTTIPGGMYPGIPNDVNTFGVKATLVTTSDESDQVVYNLTKAVFDNLQAFKSLHPVFESLEPVKMATEGRTSPYHNGAQKYYQEKGLLKGEVPAANASQSPTPAPVKAPEAAPAPTAPALPAVKK